MLCLTCMKTRTVCVQRCSFVCCVSFVAREVMSGKESAVPCHAHTLLPRECLGLCSHMHSSWCVCRCAGCRRACNMRLLYSDQDVPTRTCTCFTMALFPQKVASPSHTMRMTKIQHTGCVTLQVPPSTRAKRHTYSSLNQVAQC